MAASEASSPHHHSPGWREPAHGITVAAAANQPPVSMYEYESSNQ